MNKNEKNCVEDVALQIFLKKMPTSPLTSESERGYKSTIEQSVEIAQLFVKVRDELLGNKNE